MERGGLISPFIAFDSLGNTCMHQQTMSAGRDYNRCEQPRSDQNDIRRCRHKETPLNDSLKKITLRDDDIQNTKIAYHQSGEQKW